MPEQKIEVELPESLTHLGEKLDAIGKQIAKLEGSPITLTSGGLTPELTLLKAEFVKAEKELQQVRAEFQKQLEASLKELTETKAEVTKVRLQRRREQFIKRVQSLESLPGAPADDFAEILDHIEQGLQAVAPDKASKFFEKFNTLLTAWNAIIKKSAIFAEIGRSEIAAFSGAEGKLMALAKERVSASGGKLSYEKAYSQVMTEQPEIYHQYVAEKGA